MADPAADPAAGPQPGDLGQLTGLNRRADLNGCRVEVRGRVVGNDGGGRLAVRVLFGACAGSVLKVKPENLELDARGADPSVDELEWEMRSLATTPALAAAAAGVAEEDWRDWGRRFGNELPEEVLVKVAEKVVTQQEAEYAAHLTSDGGDDRTLRKKMKKREREGTCCLFVFALVCKPWRKAQLKAQLQVGGPLLTRVCSYVIDPGQVALAKWALAEGCPRKHENGINMAHTAAYRGHLELVQWLVGVGGFEMDEMLVERAARSGNLELMKWLQAMGCGHSFWTTQTSTMAAQGSALEVLKWLRLNNCPWTPERVCLFASLRGNLEMLRWARENGGDWENWHPSALVDAVELCKAAAQRGHLEVLQWLRETGCPWNIHTSYLAAENGHLETLRWAIENGCDWKHFETCAAAATSGKLEILQWLRAEGCPWKANTCSSAALVGHLETLRWARENGCDWERDTCTAAAHGGQLEVLQWLRAEGCPWDANTCNAAAMIGDLETLRWVRKNGCDWNNMACQWAAHGGHLEVLQWLRAEGCPWDAHTCLRAAQNGHVEVLRWLRENGCPWDDEAQDLAAELGYTDDLEGWLEESDDEYGYEDSDELSDDEETVLA